MLQPWPPGSGTMPRSSPVCPSPLTAKAPPHYLTACPLPSLTQARTPSCPWGCWSSTSLRAPATSHPSERGWRGVPGGLAGGWVCERGSVESVELAAALGLLLVVGMGSTLLLTLAPFLRQLCFPLVAGMGTTLLPTLAPFCLQLCTCRAGTWHDTWPTLEGVLALQPGPLTDHQAPPCSWPTRAGAWGARLSDLGP